MQSSSITEASVILNRVLDGASLKSQCHKNRVLYAVIHKSIKYRAILERALRASGWDGDWSGPKFAEALLLMYDLLFGVGFRRWTHVDHSLRSRLFRWQGQLLRAAKKNLAKNRDMDMKQARLRLAVPPPLPRYARVNTLIASVDAVVDALRREGFKLQREQDATDYKGPKASHLQLDRHIEALLIFPAGCELHNHHMVKSGVLILQDKASCFPPTILNPKLGSTSLDACAAPGNKTTQLAALAGPTGRVLAFERDPARATTLKRRVRLARSSVVVSVADFLTVDPSTPPNSAAEFLLLDPSCSGSGIVERSARSVGSDEVACRSDDMRRIHSLAAFQLRLLLHALTFPNARRVVYSTCSVHAIENEIVVLAAVRHTPVRHAGWRLAPALSSWPCRGLPLAAGCELCLRSGPEWSTNGFFVACFERDAPSST